MSVRSEKLYQGALPNPGGSVYVAPAGFRVIVKSILIRNQDSAASVIIFGPKPSGGSNIYTFCAVVPANNAAGSGVMYQPWAVLDPGDELFMGAGNNNVRTWVSGTLLQLP
jgi:hypothetical protein